MPFHLTPKKLILLTLSSIFFLFALTEVKETLQASANKKEIAKQEAKSAFRETFDPTEESIARMSPLGFTGEMKLYDWFFYRTNDDRTVYMGRRYSPFPTVRYLKGEDYMEFFMNKIVLNDQATDVASTTSTTLETQVLLPNDPVLHYRQIMKEMDVAYKITNIPFTVKEEIVLRSKIPNLTEDLSFFFSVETTTIPEKQQDGSIAFFDQEGNYLFQLEKPFMIDDKGNRSEEVSIEIKSTRKEKTKNSFNFEFRNFNFESILNDLILKHLNIPSFVKNAKAVSPFKIKNSSFIQNSKLEIKNSVPQHYQITLKADSEWLNSPDTVYPVTIDPTISHNSDAEFNGQMNRIADSDTTSSTQLESSYGEKANDPYTVLNLHFNEANGTTAGIRDYASTTRVIAANGNASTTNYVTQLGMGNSAAFDGDGDYLSIPDSDDFSFGAADFSVDLWLRFNALGDVTLFGRGNPGASKSVILNYVNSQGVIYFNYSIDGTNWKNQLQYTWSPSVNAWYHLALVRRGPVARVFVNGVQLTTSADYSLGTDSVFDSTSPWGIGADPTYDGSYTNGYIDSFRILKGRALTSEEIKAAASRRPYAVYTSPVLDATASVQWDTLNWTEGGVSTGNGETLYSANSLVAQWNFNETSGTTATSSTSGSCQTCAGTLNGFSYTASQDQATTTTGWTANNKKWGAGSLMFDGSNDYVSVGDNDGFDFGTGDLTIETWINPSTLSTGAGSEKGIISTYNSTADNGWRLLYYNSELLFQHLTAGSADFVQRMSFTPADSIGKWNHIAVVVSSGSATIYKNGFVTTSVSTAGTSINGDTGNNGLVIGNAQNNPVANQYFQGIIDSTRIYKGRALSAGEILSNYNAGNIELQTRTGATSDPNDGTWEAWKPTTGETQLLSMDSDQGNWNAPQQIDGYTKLLLHMDGTDTATTFPNSATTTHTITANGNAQVDTAQSKFGGASALFDGTGDYLSVPDSADWTWGSDYTIDFWMRPTAAAGTILNHEWSAQRTQLSLSAQKLSLLIYDGSVQVNFTTNNTTPLNIWSHIAVVKNGSNYAMFINGIKDPNTATSAYNMSDFTDDLTIGMAKDGSGNPGSYFTGHIDELRISKGIARWTSNFTPPPRAYGCNVKAENETTLKQEGSASTKLTLGAPQIDGNTVALWHFEETGTTTGTTLYDETANNRDLTTTGTLPSDGIFGKARRFNGSSDYATVSSSGFPTGSASRTIMAWVKSEDCANSTCFVFGYGALSAGQVFGASGYPGGNWWFQGYSTGDMNTGIAFVQNKWHHIAVSYDGTTVRFYLNGVEIANGAKSLNTGGTVFHIGDSESDTTNKWKGLIDEFVVSNRVLSADEIAETYRMGANHHLTRQVSATDLSSANKLAFNIASDRPGTYLEAMIGESDYANYELASSTLALSTTTVLYIKGDEIASSTSIKDSSFSGKAITANGNARTSGGGKIGNSLYFDGTGTGNWLTVPDSEDWNFGSGNFTIDFWAYHNTAIGSSEKYTAIDAGGGSSGFVFMRSPTGTLQFYYDRDTGGGWYTIDTTEKVSSNTWHHIVLVRNGATTYIFIDGVAATLSANISGTLKNSTGVLNIGNYGVIDNSTPMKGFIDEFRILKGTALSADQIRQAYEYGLRSHQITIDFGATLQPSDLISNATDYNFSLTATTTGLSATTSGLYLGDKIIIKENRSGTEYTAQGTVNSINTTTGAITVPLWDSGSSFPSGGFTQYATVFKWQREYFDLTGAATTTRNSITNLTLRPTNNSGGRTIYLDDFKYNTNYLTASSSSAITSSDNRFLQYRAIFSSWDPFVSPFLSALNTLYTSTAVMFIPSVGVSGDGFLMF